MFFSLDFLGICIVIFNENHVESRLEHHSDTSS